MPEFEQAEPVDCSQEAYCGMPYYLPVLNFIWKTHWVPAPPFRIAKETTITLNQKTAINKNEIRLNFTVTGNYNF